MHFLRHLLTWMLPIQSFYDGGQVTPPVGFKFVVANPDKFVVTSRGKMVIAR